MSKRIPSLDGLRALSIAAVLVGHLYGTRYFPHWIGTAAANPYFDLAQLGVRVFFIISGFLITGLLIDRCVRRPNGRLGRVLNAKPVAFVGTISYSLYLWQQLFLRRESQQSIFPLNVALAFAAALVSFYVIEQPALRARPRLEAWLAARRRRSAHQVAGDEAGHHATEKSCQIPAVPVSP